MAALLLCAIFAIVFIVWSIGKLYQATSKPEETPHADTAQQTVEQPGKTENTPAPSPKSAPKQNPDAAAKPAKLISTGQVIPNLISD